MALRGLAVVRCVFHGFDPKRHDRDARKMDSAEKGGYHGMGTAVKNEVDALNGPELYA